MKWFSISIVAALLIASCSDNPASSSGPELGPPETQVFDPYNYNCSKGQADAFCRSVGYDKAINFSCEEESGYCFPGYPCSWNGLGNVTCWRQRPISDTADSAL
jgi:hypothetical protein